MQIFPFPGIFNFPCNLTKCRLIDFDMIFKTKFLKSNKLYIASRSTPHSTPNKDYGFARVTSRPVS